uniref:Uncharacterized protein n=1 Tax=Oreochromis niloticus TaxID=8128 RepID=A0A669EYL4_ORENI
VQSLFKVVFLGNSGVGKSSFIQYYCTGRFDSKVSTTVGKSFHSDVRAHHGSLFEYT